MLVRRDDHYVREELQRMSCNYTLNAIGLHFSHISRKLSGHDLNYTTTKRSVRSFLALDRSNGWRCEFATDGGIVPLIYKSLLPTTFRKYSGRSSIRLFSAAAGKSIEHWAKLIKTKRKHPRLAPRTRTTNNNEWRSQKGVVPVLLSALRSGTNVLIIYVFHSQWGAYARTHTYMYGSHGWSIYFYVV